LCSFLQHALFDCFAALIFLSQVDPGPEFHSELQRSARVSTAAEPVNQPPNRLDSSVELRTYPHDSAKHSLASAVEDERAVSTAVTREGSSAISGCTTSSSLRSVMRDQATAVSNAAGDGPNAYIVKSDLCRSAFAAVGDGEGVSAMVGGCPAVASGVYSSTSSAAAAAVASRRPDLPPVPARLACAKPCTEAEKKATAKESPNKQVINVL
jgi:hypothetical protein